MSKIYSRPKIRIPNLNTRGTTISDIRKYEDNNNLPKKRKKSKIFPMIAIIIIALATVKVILSAIYPIFDTLCETKAKSLATIISNKEATNVMKEHSYEEMFTVEKDSNGNVTMIKSNIVAINQIISDVAVKIQEDMDKEGREKIEIPVREFHRT